MHFSLFSVPPQAEWHAWLSRYRSQLPLPQEGSTEAELVVQVATETGRNLLFLSPFVRPADVLPAAWTFSAAWAAFLRLKEVSKIQRNLKEFVGALRDDSYPSRRDTMSFFTSAICKGSHLDQPSFYDARYFCVLDGVAQTVGQYVGRCAASVIESNRCMDLFRSSLWTNTIRAHRSNPSVLGFLAEKAVLGHLASIEVVARLLGRKDLLRERVEVRTFKHGTEAATLHSSAPVALYIPEEFNYRAVDCVLRIIDRGIEKPTAHPVRRSKRSAWQQSRAGANKKKKLLATANVGAVSSPSVAIPAAPSDGEEEDDDEKKERGLKAEQADAAMGGSSSSGAASSSAAAPAAIAPAVTTTVTLLPIQVTIASCVSQSKRERSFRFFERRAAWYADFKDDPRTAIRFRFAFVVRRCAMQDAEDSIALEHDGESDTFQLSFFPLAAIDEQLDRAVDSPAGATAAAAAHNSPPRLLLPEPSKRR